MPTVLIADDDPVSLGFLQAATESLGCAAVTAANGAEALNLADASVIELLLIDLHMPDIGGPVLLQALRARGMRAPAIATSAGFETSAADALRAAGFEDILEKPASLATIQRLLCQHLALDVGANPSPADRSPGALPVLDDRSALAAIGGDHDSLRALRGLFAQELELLEHDLQGAALGSALLPDRLHRLRASSGFCGAAALAAAALRLQQSLGSEFASDAMADFVRACHATRQALAAQL